MWIARRLRSSNVVFVTELALPSRTTFAACKLRGGRRIRVSWATARICLQRVEMWITWGQRFSEMMLKTSFSFPSKEAFFTLVRLQDTLPQVLRGRYWSSIYSVVSRSHIQMKLGTYTSIG